MKQLVDKINQLPGRTLILINGSIILLTVVLLSVWLVQKQTRPDSRADSSTQLIVGRLLISPTQSPVYIPTKKPKITRVIKPYGKIGDAVVIEGNNFGAGPPPNSGIWFGDRVVTTWDVQEWSNNRLVVKVPDIIQPQPIQIKVAGQAVAWAGPFTVYDETTETELSLIRNEADRQDSLVMQFPPADTRLIVKIKITGTELMTKLIKPGDGWRIVKTEIIDNGLTIKLTTQDKITSEMTVLLGWPLLNAGELVELKYVSIYNLDTGQFVPFWIEPGNDKLGQEGSLKE